MKAVIFDMDGLIIDSEPIHSLAFESIVREYGRDPILHESGIIQKPGLREDENWEEIMATHGFSGDINRLSKKRHIVFATLVRKNAKAQRGLRKLLNALKHKGIKMAVASSNSHENINVVLEALRIAHYFDTVVSGKAVRRGKPFPDTFLEAAKRLNVAPRNCVVLEDAQSGVIAGKAAGMKVVAVPNKYTRHDKFSKADLVVSSLYELTVEKLKTA